jgi:hypothetical protein
MQIKITEQRISDVGPDGVLHVWVEGDVATVDDAYGATLCGRGWATDVAGKVPTGERKPGAETLEVKKMRVTSQTAPKGRRGGAR